MDTTNETAALGAIIGAFAIEIGPVEGHSGPLEPLLDQLREEIRGRATGRNVSRVFWLRLRTMAHAEVLAAALGDGFIATDAGGGCSPRYDVRRMPQVGDPVSYCFNGDAYPDGEIVSIGKGRRATVTTSGGHRYNRRGLSGVWMQTGGTWSLVHGHQDKRNPHF